MTPQRITNDRNRARRRRLAQLSLILISAPLWAQIPTVSYQGQEVAANEVLVKFKSSPNISAPQTLAQINLAEDIASSSAIGAGDIWRLRSRSKDVATLVTELSARPEVAYAEPNYVVHALETPNDPYFGNLWGLKNTGQVIQGVAGKPGADISATSAWNSTTGSAANVVAVVDTGIDYYHPDLAPNVWSAPSSFTIGVGTTPITCPAGSHGFNAITWTCDPYDDNGHGTHVSGTIGAVGNNSVGVAGVNWTANIMAVKFLNSSGIGFTADAINAIEFAVEAKAALGVNVRVLSNSWGGGALSLPLLDEIDRANLWDILFVAAAGNSASNNDVDPHYPASYTTASNVVAVAATDNTDALASFSDYGKNSVHLGAPGVNVFSTLPGATYGFLSGTSMATPHVSGAAALVLSICNPLDTPGLKAALLNSVDPIPALSGITITGGRLNVNKAVSPCTAPSFTLTATPVYKSKTTISGFNVSVTAKNGFNGTVSLSCSDPGFSCSVSPSAITGSGTAVVTGPSFASDWNGTLTATSGGIIRTAALEAPIITGPGGCGSKPCQ